MNLRRILESVVTRQLLLGLALVRYAAAVSGTEFKQDASIGIALGDGGSLSDHLLPAADPGDARSQADGAPPFRVERSRRSSPAPQRRLNPDQVFFGITICVWVTRATRVPSGFLIVVCHTMVVRPKCSGTVVARSTLPSPAAKKLVFDSSVVVR